MGHRRTRQPMSITTGQVSPAEVVRQQRAYFKAGYTQPLENRLEQLKAIKAGMEAYESRILEAHHEDFRLPAREAYTSNVYFPTHEAKEAIKHLRSWAKPQRVGLSLVQQPASSKLFPQPYGVAAIISPWNFPFLLSISPLVGAVAAGNTAIIKPSEYTTHCSQVMEEMVAEYLDNRWVQVIQGEVETSQALLAEKLDYIFFTGSTAVGKIIMKAAAEHLTPVTLELGGKNPVIIDETANIPLAAKRIVWGKCFNGGQSCVGPDYLLVHESVKALLVKEIKTHIQQYFGEDPQQSPDFARMINDRHFDRVANLIQGKVLVGGQTDAATRYIAPTVLEVGNPYTHPAMQEEIFAPMMVLMSYGDLGKVIEFINERPRPLALYLFSTNKDHQDRMMRETYSGSLVFNDVVYHFTASELPFGGIGESGMGAYHGKYSFDTFSHFKGVYSRSNLVDVPLRYPPYNRSIETIKRLLNMIS